MDKTAIYEESNRAETLLFRIVGGTAFRPGKYQRLYPHEDTILAVFKKLKWEHRIMKKRSIPQKTSYGGKQAQVLYVDGCKISVKYRDKDNPPVVKKIKDTLIAGGSIKKS